MVILLYLAEKSKLSLTRKFRYAIIKTAEMGQLTWQRKVCRATTKLRERAKKEAPMSEFQKKYVRVEWLAVQKAVDLMREAGFDNSYFVRQSHLVGDEGTAPLLAEVGRELFDEDGHHVRFESLPVKDLGFDQEIGEFEPRYEGIGGTTYDDCYFLKRTYQFIIFRQGEKVSEKQIMISFAKRRQENDWEVVLEGVVDGSRSGGDRWIVYRPEKKA